MADRPLNAREGRTGYDPVFLGIIFAGVVALLLLIYAFMFRAEKSVDVNRAQPNIETPVTGETPKP